MINLAQYLSKNQIEQRLQALKELVFREIDKRIAAIPKVAPKTITFTSANEISATAHTHKLEISPNILGRGDRQYQVIVTGASPFPADYSLFLLDGTSGGKTVFAVTSTKTLTLTATDDYNLTVPATGTAALLGTANVFTAANTFNGVTVVNEAGAAANDLRAESDAEENMIFLDASANTLYLGGSTNGIKIEQAGELTLLGTATVFNDANVGGLVLQTGGTLPGIVEWLDNDGDATGIYTRGFAINEQGSGSIEIPHDYKEGTNITFHIHWGANDAPSGTDYVKWQLTYSITESETTFPDSTSIVVETAYDTQYETKRSDFPAIVGTALTIGRQVNFTIKRITADGDAFAGEALIETIGFHYECDTIGSKTITAK